MEKYLRPTTAIDSNSKSIIEKARNVTEGHREITEKARSLFYFVRDEIKYNFYVLRHFPEDYRASATLARGEGFCVQKAVLLTALARAAGIPARLRFAAIRNHLAPDRIKEILGTNLFVSHGYSELHIEGKWIKAAPTFHLGMCEQKRFIPVEFDGKNDALLPRCNQDGDPHIEYVRDYGDYDDVPADMLHRLKLQGYGPGYVARLKQMTNVMKAAEDE